MKESIFRKPLEISKEYVDRNAFWNSFGGVRPEIISENTCENLVSINIREKQINPERAHKRISGGVPGGILGKNSKEVLEKECTLKEFLEKILEELVKFVKGVPGVGESKST